MTNGALDTGKLVDHIKLTLPPTWTPWPGGRPGQVEAALIDSVLSIRAAYGRAADDGRAATGVHRSIDRYAAANAAPLDDLERLAAMDPAHLAELLGNQQKTAQRTKASAIVEAAANLVAVGVRRAADVQVDDPAQMHAWTKVKGLGSVTWKYFAMLLGAPGVKADTWIIRFVRQALGRPVDAKTAERLVKKAATEFGKSATELDHAIWAHARSTGRRRRRR